MEWPTPPLLQDSPLVVLRVSKSKTGKFRSTPAEKQHYRWRCLLLNKVKTERNIHISSVWQLATEWQICCWTHRRSVLENLKQKTMQPLRVTQTQLNTEGRKKEHHHHQLHLNNSFLSLLSQPPESVCVDTASKTQTRRDFAYHLQPRCS